MKTENIKWLCLQPYADTALSSLYLIFQTHHSIFSYLSEQGYTINIYLPLPGQHHQQKPVIYVQTDHIGFLESCLKNYARHYSISGLEPGFVAPKTHGPISGNDNNLQQALRVS